MACFFIYFSDTLLALADIGGHVGAGVEAEMEEWRGGGGGVEGVE